ncbi:MAG: sulfatase-like hydrolase/transferase [Deltaproteobacteria bacterium]|nr:sulfatase-like hydrolase/transferase [Deltaproteobacteria bacterium]
MPKVTVPKLTIVWMLFTALLIIGLSTTALIMGCRPEVTKGPNILLIISDDVGMDVTTNMVPGLIENLEKRYGPSGHDHPGYRAIKGSPASTPRLDKLVHEGMFFTNVWAHPFCSPTRAAILTGLFGKKARVLTPADALSRKHTSFVQKLKDEGGYSTALFGKWHLSGFKMGSDGPEFPGLKPKEAGFELFKGNLHAAIASYWDYEYHVQDNNTPANEVRTEKAPVRSLPGLAGSRYAPQVKVADAIEWITEKEKENPDKPWFAWVAFNLSHTTIIQQPSAMAVPDAATLDKRSLEEMKACGGVFGSNNNGTCSGEALMRAMTNSLDTLTGMLLDAVDRLDPNTYVIFISDNGTPMYGRPNLNYIDNMYITRKGRGKGTAYESGALVPMAVKGPGIRAGASSETMAHAVDIFSTVLSLAGLEAPQQVSNSEGNGMVPLDSVSLTPVLFGGKDTVRDPINGYVLTESINIMTGGTPHIGARNMNYKLVCAGGNKPGNCEFYNIDDDPLEEYPLQKPGSCAGYSDGSWTSASPEWNFCRLIEVVRDYAYDPEAEKKSPDQFITLPE